MSIFARGVGLPLRAEDRSAKAPCTPDDRLSQRLVEVTTAAGDSVGGGGGLLVEFAPAEGHEIVASSRCGYCCC